MEVETEMDIEIRMFEIIEFMESGSTAGYQEDEDVVLQTYSAQAWDDLVDETPATATFLQVSGSTSDGVLTVRLYVTPTFQTFDSFEIDPNTFKFDLVISNFPWTQDNSTLAIASRVETSLEVEIESDDDNDAVDVAVSNPDADVSAVFAWASTVQTSAPDGTISVIATEATSVEEDNLLYFTLDAAVHPETFIWDPSVSVTDGSIASITSAASHFSVAPVLLLGMIGLFNLFF